MNDLSIGLHGRNIVKNFYHRRVLDSVNVSLYQGESVGLLGPNGAGKTTLFSILCGITPADAGEILLDGLNITNAPMYKRARAGLNYLPQEPSIFRGLNVEDNLLAVLEYVESNKYKRQEILQEIMEEMSISHLRKSSATTLSGGERRRVEIARARALNAKYIMLDEPLAGIDPIAVDDTRAMIKNLKNYGMGVLITDHKVRETLSMVDRAYILNQGHVIMHGTPEEIINHPEVRRVYLGESFIL